MKLLIENWRKLILSEAAKNAKDLKNFHEENWMEHKEMVRGMWKKYGMWKVDELLNIGIPKWVKKDWSNFPNSRKRKFTKAYFDAALDKEPPIPIIVIDTIYGSSLEVSYGGILPRYEKPAVLLKFDSGEQAKSGNLMKKAGVMTGMPAGSITFYKADASSDGQCLDSWIVDSTHQTTAGWGPLLYDIAMEVATVLGGGLTSSRTMVSSHAKPVWDFYQDRRSDVDPQQMDVEKGEAQRWGLEQLTPNDPKDDCIQTAAYKWAHGAEYGAWEKRTNLQIGDVVRALSPEEKKEVPWDDQSISKSYTKDPDILKFLGDNGLLHFPKLGYDAIKFHTKKLPPMPSDEEPPVNDEMEKAREQFRAQSTLSERKIRIKIK